MIMLTYSYNAYVFKYKKVICLVTCVEKTNINCKYVYIYIYIYINVVSIINPIIMI